MSYPNRLITATQIRESKKDALEELDMLFGRGKWNYPGNWFYGDGYFANSIKNKFKCQDLSKLEEWAKS